MLYKRFNVVLCKFSELFHGLRPQWICQAREKIYFLFTTHGHLLSPSYRTFFPFYMVDMLQVKSNLRSICSNLGQFVSTWVNLLQPRSICLIIGQFDFFLLFLRQTKNIFGTFDLLFILLLLFISTTYLNYYSLPALPILFISMRTCTVWALNHLHVTFGFPLDSCPDALPLSHGDLDASSTIFLITYTVVVINFLKLFKSDILIKENTPPVITLQYMYLCPNYTD